MLGLKNRTLNRKAQLNTLLNLPRRTMKKWRSHFIIRKGFAPSDPHALLKPGNFFDFFSKEEAGKFFFSFFFSVCIFSYSPSFFVSLGSSWFSALVPCLRSLCSPSTSHSEAAMSNIEDVTANVAPTQHSHRLQQPT